MNYQLQIHLLNVQVEELIKIIDSLEKTQEELVKALQEATNKEVESDEQVSEDK
jgi:hypothetical protein